MGDQINNYEMGAACNMFGSRSMYIEDVSTSIWRKEKISENYAQLEGQN
jgi:hypothetical protein